MTRPPYPRTPAYGEGVQPRSGARTDVTAGGATPHPPVPTADVRGVRLSMALALGLNLVTLVGVLVLGWPAGNVFLLFWVENVVLGLVTLVRVVTAEAPDTRRPRGDGRRRATAGSRIGTAAFFCVHYGIFCAVHLVFTYLVASALGIDDSWLLLGVPVVLVLVRYAVELATTWFGAGGLRERTSPGQAMASPYPRVVVLHLAVLLTFVLGLLGLAVAGGAGAGWDSRGVLAVALLLVLKTVVDLATTRRALRQKGEPSAA